MSYGQSDGGIDIGAMDTAGVAEVAIVLTSDDDSCSHRLARDGEVNTKAGDIPMCYMDDQQKRPWAETSAMETDTVK